jgi:hypothetical protein
MLSVIVPTMWRYEPFLDFLELVLNKTTPFIYWENEGDLSRAYVVRLNSNSSKLDYKVRARAFESSLSFIELI